ncbi:MAG: PD40 domain-containing protein, partial [Acidobacteria bacterium]|nr:PD40 domain-containing protein [Acidobacteriota bacterium]
MKHVAGLLALISIGCTAQAASQATDARRLTIEQLIDIRHPSSPIWTPDGRAIVFAWDRAG